jgi:hypothetical protein
VYRENGTHDEVSILITNNQDNIIDGDLLKDIVKHLDPCRADNYDTWIRGDYGIFNIAHENDYKIKGRNLIHKFSNKSNKYNEDVVERFINSIPYRPNGIGLGYLMECLKKDNKDAFKNIFKNCVGQLLILSPSKDTQLCLVWTKILRTL